MKLNVKEMYDAVERKHQVEPRPIRRGDVLEHGSGVRYLVVAVKDLLILGNLHQGTRYGDGATVHDAKSLTREEAKFLCGGNPDCFRLLGPAKDVLTVQDPENSP